MSDVVIKINISIYLACLPQCYSTSDILLQVMPDIRRTYIRYPTLSSGAFFLQIKFEITPDKTLDYPAWQGRVAFKAINFI